MKILMVNKFLYPKGGAETYILELGKILQAKGHRVQYFGLENEKNIVGNSAGSYVSHLDLSAGAHKNLTALFRILYSVESRRKIRRVLDTFHPDVVHLNNIQFHLTPSVILEVQKYREETGRNAKIIYTAHDFQLICPSHGLFGPDWKPCEKCLGGNYLPCLQTRCVKHSRAKSLLGMLDACIWKRSRAYSYIDTIICCSEFLKSRLDAQPRFQSKTITLHNFAGSTPRFSQDKADYVLEFGHLSRQKGTYTLLEAARQMPEVRFVFAGYGDAVPAIQNVPNGEYVGFLTGRPLEDLIRKARVSVCPSEYYENCPFSVIESQMYGTPVVGARMGGIPELILEGKSGELFTAGDSSDLVRALHKVLARPVWYSENCRLCNFETPESYYEKLMAIYGA